MAYCNKEIRKPAAEFEGFQKMHFGARMRESSAFNTLNDANGAIAAMCAWEHPREKTHLSHPRYPTVFRFSKMPAY